MKQFDYRTAWHQVAKPAFDALPENVRALYAELPALQQGPTLAIDCPPELLARFEAIGTRILAVAARVCHDYGHWWPGDAGKDPHAGNGWRFANIADQVLAKRLGYRSRFEREGLGISRRIIEGAIRVQCATKDSWQWVEIGLADEITAIEANAFDATADRFDRSGRLISEGSFPAKAAALRAAVFARDTVASWLLGADRYMVGDS